LIKILRYSLTIPLFLYWVGCSPSGGGEAGATVLSDDSLMTLIQYQTFRYFWEGAEPNSGMARERYHVDGIYPQDDKNVVASGGSGFGIMAILVGIERGFITRDQGLRRLEKIVGFLEKAERFRGLYSHWI